MPFCRLLERLGGMPDVLSLPKSSISGWTLTKLVRGFGEAFAAWVNKSGK